jgi:hypothetical protein
MDEFTETLEAAGGVWLRREAIANGYDDKAIARMVRSGDWHRVRHGAYCSGSLWEGLDAVGRHRVKARAVLLTAHPSAALSHVSAALELNAPVWLLDLSEVHVTREDGRAGRRESGVVHHCGEIAPGDIIGRNGVRVTNGTRAAIEVTTLGNVERSLVTVNGLLHAQETTREELARATEAMKHWPHSLRSDLVVRLADPRIESAGESRTFYLFWSQGLPLPVPQHCVFDEAGSLVARLDFALPDLGVFVEFDGRQKYLELRRDGETIEDVILREKRREELVCRLTGWVCIRIAWEDLARPAQTARRIRAILTSRERAMSGRS